MAGRMAQKIRQRAQAAPGRSLGKAETYSEGAFRAS
jgi:hypothetical protein